MGKSKVSIIIPVFRVEKFIVRCLESVVNQTYKNIEVILIDDCGGDNSSQIGVEYLRGQNTEFKFIQNEKNSGPSFSRNRALAAADGDYIYFLDSDDCIHETCIEKLVDVLENETYNSDVVFSDFIRFYPGEDFFPRVNNSKPEKYPVKDRIDFVRKHGFACATLYRKSIIDEFCVRFPEEVRYMEDNLFNIDYLKHISKDSIYCIDEQLYFYYINPVSLSRPGSQEKIVKLTLDCSNYYEKIFCGTDLSLPSQDLTEAVKTRRYFRNCFFGDLNAIDESLKSFSIETGDSHFLKKCISKSDMNFIEKTGEYLSAVPAFEKVIYKFKYFIPNLKKTEDDIGQGT